VFERESGGFDAIIGNPPYVAGRNISGSLGNGYLDWLTHRSGTNPGQADLAAHFVHHARLLCNSYGCVGVVATNTVTQGDSARLGLGQAIDAGATIYFAQRRVVWPGGAAVHVSAFCITNGPFSRSIILDDQAVKGITAVLRSTDFERYQLQANKGRASKGFDLGGDGFVLSADARHPSEKSVLWPHINGKELYTRPAPVPDRYVINFLDWPLEKAEQYPAPR
jgi:hypothetical protein